MHHNNFPLTFTTFPLDISLYIYYVFLSVTSYIHSFIALIFFVFCKIYYLEAEQNHKETNMSSFIFNCFIIFLAATTFTCVQSARQFQVGGRLGWHEPEPNNTAFYTQWAERNRFQIGDSLGI
jgi:hypothetical protein